MYREFGGVLGWGIAMPVVVIAPCEHCGHSG